MASRSFSWSNFFLRLSAAIVVVLATYNPSGLSYYDWVWPWESFDPFKAIVGILLLIAWVMGIRATIHSLGVLGMILAVAFFGVVIWMVIYMNLIPADSRVAVTWLILIALGGVLGVGLSWSHVRRRLTGQLDVDVDAE